MPGLLPFSRLPAEAASLHWYIGEDALRFNATVPCVIPEGAGPVNSGFLFVIFLLAALRLPLGAPG
jgi:hypothetical protein